MLYNALTLYTAKITPQTTSHNLEDGRELVFKVNRFSRFIIIAVSVPPDCQLFLYSL